MKILRPLLAVFALAICGVAYPQGLTNNFRGAVGPTGPTGLTGPAGPGLATGGAAGALLYKTSGTNYETSWSTSLYESSGKLGVGLNNPSSALHVRSIDANGASAVAATVDTTTAWSNATAKLLQIKSNNVEKASIDATGNVNLLGGNGIRFPDDEGTMRSIFSHNAGATSIKSWRGGSLLDGFNGVTYLYTSGAPTAGSMIALYGKGNANNIGVKIYTSDTFVDTEKLLSIQNNTTEKFYVLATGYASSAGAPVGRAVSVPPTAATACSVGDFSSDASYFYVCTATDTWKRASIAAW